MGFFLKKLNRELKFNKGKFLLPVGYVRPAGLRLNKKDPTWLVRFLHRRFFKRRRQLLVHGKRKKNKKFFFFKIFSNYLRKGEKFRRVKREQVFNNFIKTLYFFSRQKHLNKDILKLRKNRSLNKLKKLLIFFESKLVVFLIRTGLVRHYGWAFYFIKNGYIFVNGSKIKNYRHLLFEGDLVEIRVKNKNFIDNKLLSVYKKWLINFSVAYSSSFDKYVPKYFSKKKFENASRFGYKKLHMPKLLRKQRKLFFKTTFKDKRRVATFDAFLKKEIFVSENRGVLKFDFLKNSRRKAFNLKQNKRKIFFIKSRNNNLLSVLKKKNFLDINLDKGFFFLLKNKTKFSFFKFLETFKNGSYVKGKGKVNRFSSRQDKVKPVFFKMNKRKLHFKRKFILKGSKNKKNYQTIKHFSKKGKRKPYPKVFYRREYNLHYLRNYLRFFIWYHSGVFLLESEFKNNLTSSFYKIPFFAKNVQTNVRIKSAIFLGTPHLAFLKFPNPYFRKNGYLNRQTLEYFFSIYKI